MILNRIFDRPLQLPKRVHVRINKRANPALKLDNQQNYLLNRDIFIFDANSPSAHIIARTILVNDPYQYLNLIPKQNSAYFGIHIPNCHAGEQFVLLTQNGEFLSGDEALELVSTRLKLDSSIH